MRKGRRTQRARVAVLAFIGVAVAVHAVLATAVAISIRLRDPFFGDKAAKLAGLMGAKPEHRIVLAVGSSRTGLGFSGLSFEAKYGKGIIAFNFGIPGAGPITQEVYLRRLLDRGARPDLLLLEVLPVQFHQLDGVPVESVAFRPEMARRSELRDLARYGYKADPCRAVWRESTLFPMGLLRDQLLGRIAPGLLKDGCRFDWSRSSDPRGWNPTPFTARDEADRLAKGANIRRDHGAALSALLADGGPLAAFEESLLHARVAKVPTRIVWMPEASDYRKLYPPAVVERFQSLRRRWLEDFGVDTIDARDWMPDDAFIDCHHLSMEGAREFSSRLAAFLGESGMHGGEDGG